MQFETMVVTRRFGSNQSQDDPKDANHATHRVRYVRASPQSHTLSLLQLNLQSLTAARAFSPDLVISGHTWTSPAASMIRHSMSLPVLQYLYADELTAHPRLTRYALRHSDASIAISEYTRSLALRFGADRTRLHLVPPGVDIPVPLCTTIGRRKRATLITVARLTDRYKGHDLVLQALPLVLEHVPDCEWLVVGDGPLAGELRQLARERGLDGHVSFLGAVDDDERDRLLGQAHVFIMPSRLPPGEGGEGFGIVYLEAGLHGLPVIAGNVGGALDAVEHERTGLLVEPTDIQEIASAVIRLLTDRAEAESMGRAGAARARRFAWPLIAERVEKISREMVTQN
jgi:phosphatidylinositol alpha-1,6-mannosyltransferase